MTDSTDPQPGLARRVWSWLRHHPILVAYLLIGAVAAGGLARIEQTGEDGRQALCRKANAQLVVVQELVRVATEDPDDGAGLAAVTSLPEFQALDDTDKAFWLVILSGTLRSGPSVSERLLAFSETLRPEDCDGA